MELSNLTRTSVINLIANKEKFTDQQLIDAIYLRIETELIYRKADELRKECAKTRFELEKAEELLTIKNGIK